MRKFLVSRIEPGKTICEGTYAPGRGAVHAMKLLDNYAGIVQRDGYAAYKTLADAARDNRGVTLPPGSVREMPETARTASGV